MNKSISRRPSKIHDRAYQKLLSLGITGSELFTFDNWSEILKEAYTNEDTGYLHNISALKNRSAQYFRKTGYKRSVAFLKLYHTNTGRLISMVIEIGEGLLRSEETHKAIDSILSHRVFKDVPLMYNTQRGQKANSLHIHILCYWPNSRKIPHKVRGYILRSDVELSMGKYFEIPIAVSIRKFVQYLRFPSDQRYRASIDGARVEAYREAFEDYLLKREPRYTLPTNTMRLSGERNMRSVLAEVTEIEAALELERFEDFQRAKEYKRLEKLRESMKPSLEFTSEEGFYNPTVVTQELPISVVQHDEKRLLQTSGNPSQPLHLYPMGIAPIEYKGAGP